jgi:hypothetical protein
MQPLYLARIEDLGRGDVVKVNCAAGHQVARCGPRTSCCGSGSAGKPRCSISNRGVRYRRCGAKRELSCRSSGAAGAGEAGDPSPPNSRNTATVLILLGFRAGAPPHRRNPGATARNYRGRPDDAADRRSL